MLLEMSFTGFYWVLLETFSNHTAYGKSWQSAGWTSTRNAAFCAANMVGWITRCPSDDGEDLAFSPNKCTEQVQSLSSFVCYCSLPPNRSHCMCLLALANDSGVRVLVRRRETASRNECADT